MNVYYFKGWANKTYTNPSNFRLEHFYALTIWCPLSSTALNENSFQIMSVSLINPKFLR